MKEEVVIVGAGPSGLAIVACLNVLSIPNVVLEKEDTYAYLWKHKVYDRLKLHLAKEFCALPCMPHSDSAPKYIPKDDFLRYLDDYVTNFEITPVYNTQVESASYDEEAKTWTIKTLDTEGEEEYYIARFLVIATGENAQGFVPDVPGLNDHFRGDIVHSSEYKSGVEYSGKEVLVVGCGNSGMEIAYDLSNYGANTYISIRSPFHVMNKELICLAMNLMKSLPLQLVDDLILSLSSTTYGDLSEYGIVKPKVGPLVLKAATGRSAVIDVGTIDKIKKGEIKVVKELIRVTDNNEAVFEHDDSHYFDAIIFATGYRSTAKNWLKEDGWLFNEDGFPKEKYPNHWKGENGLYCVGLSRRGLAGIATDAEKVADDIATNLKFV